jgi:uncharacterized protein YndB with AHSA1/START domain
MTRDKDRKRIIRNRMKNTGESYTAARRQVLARAVKRTSPPRPAANVETSRTARSHAPVTSDEAIKRQTGYSWDAWVGMLDAEGAAAMAHRDIARLVHQKYGVADWWSQAVTVGYERLKGRREPGQRLNGAYEVSKSKTFNVPVAALFDAFADNSTRRRWLDGINATIRTATAPKSMRLQWPDGTIVALWFAGKGDGKSTVALAHTKLTSRADLEKARADWGARLDRLSRLLARDR